MHFTCVNSTPHAYLSDATTTEYGQEELYYDPSYDTTSYVDSGATNHITHDINNMHISSPYHGLDQVAVGNDNQLPFLSTSSYTFSILLNNTLYVPQITKNLIITSQFTKNNNVYY